MYRHAALFVVWMFFAVAPLHAADYCAGSAAQLQSMLDQAATDGEDSVVRVRSGTYTLGADIEYPGDTTEWLIPIGELDVRGGYNVDCSARSGVTAFSASSDRGLRLRTVRGSVKLRDLTFNGVDLYVTDNLLGECVSSARYFTLDRIRMDSAVFLPSAKCHEIEVRDSVFSNGQPFDEYGDLLMRSLLITDEDYRPSRLTVVNSSFVNGTTAFWNFGPSLATARVANSLFTRIGNDIVNENALFIHHSRFDGITHASGGAAFSSTDNTAASVGLDAQFVPNPGSAMVNAGSSNVWGGLGETDVYGEDRVIGARPDIGGAESPVDGSGIYTVTNSAASGTGSLAAAIALANQDPAFNRIRFAISGGCPKRITVATGFNLAGPVGIDGYSQSGSVRNSEEFQWNAAPCIILDGVTNTGTAFVTSGALGQSGGNVSIIGLAFERFDTAILLSYGVNHSVRGNQFGGQVGDSGPTLRANNNAITVAGEGRSLIGGNALADANLISGSTGAGVLITGASNHDTDVIGNRIGYDKNAFSALPNQDGVRVTATGNRITGNRIGGNTRDGVVLSGSNTYDNEVSDNQIGSASDAFLVPAGNGRMGVMIENTAHHNRVYDNSIGNNGDSGVRVMSDAGGSNEISGNVIAFNDAPGIDLGADGVSANSFPTIPPACHVTTGCPGNGGLNFPTLTSVRLRPSGVLYPINQPVRIEGNLTMKPSANPFRIELYANNACDASGNGQGQRVIGSISVTVTNAGACFNGYCTASFVAHVAEDVAGLGDAISAITIAANGNTSEFSACRRVELGDRIFANGFDSN